MCKKLHQGGHLGLPPNGGLKHYGGSLFYDSRNGLELIYITAERIKSLSLTVLKISMGQS